MTVPVLYVSYDGMLEPLGQSQVLAYLEHLAAERRIHLLSFEKPEDWSRDVERQALAARMTAAGISWHPRTYHRRPSAPATACDVAVGVVSGLWLVLRHRIGIVHARSYVPAVMALVLKKICGTRFVFDMRGFWADERVDGGLWPRGGRLYRLAKWFERQFLLNADHVVSLTDAAVREMLQFPYLVDRRPAVTVIPTCADLQRFVPMQKPGTGFVLGYVGSVGTWYQFDAVVECFSILLQLRPDARLLLVNRGDHAYIRQALADAGIPADQYEVISASHAEVPRIMARMHAGLFFYKPSPSRSACAPTKLGEFLGCGIPCLSNAGVGDMSTVLEGDNVGIAVRDFSAAELQRGVERLLALVADPATSQRCVDSAARHFSLAEGVRRYREVYRSLEVAR